MEGNNNNKTVLSIVLILIAIALAGATYYFFFIQEGEGILPQRPQEREVAGEGDEQENQESPTVKMPKPEMGEKEVAVYFVDLGNQRNIEETFGCDDSLSYLTRSLNGEDLSLEETIERTLSFLVTEPERNVGKGGLYNVFYNSDLTVDRVEVEDSTASIYLDGELSLGGTCDTPRVEAQLENTATQFEEVDSIEMYLNDEPLNLFLR